MLLAYSVTFHEARDWIGLQDQSALMYQSLQQHCKLLEQECKQYRKVQLKGRAQLTTLAAATATHSSVHQDAITVNSTCHRCGYSHQRGNCPTTGKDATTAAEQDIPQPYAGPGTQNTQTITGKVDPTREDQDTAADPQAQTVKNHLAETTNCTADIEVNHPHTAADVEEALHHTKLTPSHSTVTHIRNRQNPEEHAPPLTLTSMTSTQQNQTMTQIQVIQTQK